MNDAENSAKRESPRTGTAEQAEAAQRTLAVRRKIKNYLILSSIGLLVIIPLVILGMFMGRSGSASKGDGTPAVARVDRLGEGFCWVGFEGSSCLSLNLTVFPEVEAPFTAVVVVNVEDRWLSKVQPGAYVRVVRDREEPSKVYLNTEALPNAPPAPPSAAESSPSR